MDGFDDIAYLVTGHTGHYLRPGSIYLYDCWPPSQGDGNILILMLGKCGCPLSSFMLCYLPFLVLSTLPIT